MSQFDRFFDLSDERGVLRTSIIFTIVLALAGVAFGLFSGSRAVIFDGVYDLIDAAMGILSLIVVNLITSYASASGMSRKLRDRFSMGFWHLEPIVLVLNGTLLIGAAVYALLNAVGSILEGGRDLEFGWAIVYTVIAAIAAAIIATVEVKANKAINSEFIRLDVKAWIMSGGITVALLVAFCIGYLLQGTPHAWVTPYIDPAVLAIICVLIIPLPISTIRQALADILLVTPSDLKQHVDTVAQAFVEKHGFSFFRVYVARVGRSQDIELYFIVPPGAPARTIEEWDALRDEVGDQIGGDGPHQWLTIVFTGDPEWA